MSAPELRTPAEWSALDGVTVMDPDGWRGCKHLSAKSWDEPIDRDEWEERLSLSTQSLRTVPEPTVRVTRYEVSCLPQSNVNADLFTLSVEERSEGRWAVLRGGMCYDADGVREFESMTTGRTDEFIARFRFDLDTALALAKRIAPTMKVNRHTVADALARADA